MNDNRFFALHIEENQHEATIYLYGGIPDVDWSDFTLINTGRDFVKAFKPLDAKYDQIHIHINSPGGFVDEGLAIFNTIRSAKAHVTTYNDSLAASMGSVILLAGDTVKAPKNSLMMIHNCWGLAVGNAQDLREAADVQDKFDEVLMMAYADKLGKPVDDIKATYFNYKDQWLTGQEAYDAGFVDELLNEVADIPEVEKDAPLDMVQNRMAASIKIVSIKNDNMNILQLFGFSKETAAKLSAEDKQRLESAEEKLNSLETERDTAKAELVKAQEANGTLTNRVAELEKAATETQAAHAKAIKALEDEKAQLHAKLDKKPAAAATTATNANGEDDETIDQETENKYETSADREMAQIKGNLKITK